MYVGPMDEKLRLSIKVKISVPFLLALFQINREKKSVACNNADKSK